MTSRVTLEQPWKRDVEYLADSLYIQGSDSNRLCTWGKVNAMIRERQKCLHGTDAQHYQYFNADWQSFQHGLGQR